MIEALSLRELPYVEDGQRGAEEPLAELLEAFVDGDLPGIGILHTDDRMPSHRSMHLWHANLVLKAMAILEPSVQHLGFKAASSQLPMDSSTEPHTDDYADRQTEETKPCLKMGVRLHTNGPGQAADVVLANTAPGYYSIFNDVEVSPQLGKLPNVLIAKWQYEMEDLLCPVMLAEAQVAERALAQNTLVNEAVIYEFDQTPRSSVMFRTRADVGPVSLHGFSAPERCTRQVLLSDMYLRAH